MKTTIFKVATIVAFLFFTVSSALPQDTLVLTPGPADATIVYVNSYSDTYNGPESETILSCYWTMTGIPGVGRSFMKFDLSSVPPAATIISATLSLYYFQGNNAANAGDNASLLRRVTEPWVPALTFFYNQPAATTTDQILLPTAAPYVDFPDVDMTPFVEFWTAKPDSNFGFMLRLVDESEIYTCLTFGSPYGPTFVRPQLEIVYLCDKPVALFGSVTNNLTVTFSDSSVYADSWLWDFGDGFISNLQNPVHTYNALGTYNVCLTVANDCDTDLMCDSVHAGPSGIPGFDQSEMFAVSPNPTSGVFTLRCPEQIQGVVKCRLRTIGGQELLDRQFVQTTPGQLLPIDPGMLAPGVYMVEASTANGTQTFKLVIRKE